jgi:hypothetical protein
MNKSNSDLPQVELDAAAETRPERPSGEPFVLLCQEAGSWHASYRTSGLLAFPNNGAKSCSSGTRLIRTNPPSTPSEATGAGKRAGA